jgi:hypothetical protein
MALGFKEAQIRGPLPKTQVAEPDFPTGQQNEVQNKVVPLTSPTIASVAGPNDPLVGPTHPDDISGLVQTNNAILDVLQKILIATRALHANMSIIVKGPAVLQAGSGEKYTFDIGGKRVPSLNTFIQNNTPNIVYIGIEDAAGIYGIQVAPNGGQLQIADIAVSWISIWVTALTNINGTDNMGQPIATVANPSVGIIVLAWSNAEWNNVWGQTA